MDKSGSQNPGIKLELSFYDNAQPMLFYDTETLKFLAANKAAENIYGYTEKEFLALTIKDIRPEEDVPKLMKYLSSKPHARGKNLRLWRHTKKDGTIIYVDVISQPIEFNGRRARLVFPLFLDESERAERDSSFLASIVESSDDAIIGKQLDGTLISWNKAAEKIFGYQKEEVIGKSIKIIVPDNLKNEIDEIDAKIIAGEKIEIFETLRKTKDGRILNIALTVSPIKDADGNIIGISAIDRDITGKKKIEKELKESEEKFRLITENIRDAFFIARIDTGELIYVSHAYDEIRGEPVNISEKKHWGFLDFMLEEDKQKIIDAIEAGKKTGIFNEEYRIVDSKGENKWIHAKTFPVKKDDGVIELLAGVAEDITIRKLAEERFRFHSYLISNMKDAVIATDRNFVITTWNTAAEEMYGYFEKEVLGRKTKGLLQSDYTEEEQEAIKEKIKREGFYNTEVKLRCKNNVPVYSHVNVIALKNVNGEITGYLSVSRDVTEKKFAEKKLKRHAKHLQALNEISTVFNRSTLNYQALLVQITVRVAELLKETCLIRLLSDDKNYLEPVAYHDPDPEAFSFIKLILISSPLSVNEEEISCKVFKSGESLLLPEVMPEKIIKDVKPEYRELVEKYPPKSIIIVPIRYQNETIGTMMLARRSENLPSFYKEDLCLTQDIADRAGLAITNAKLYQELTKTANKLEEKVAVQKDSLSKIKQEIFNENRDIMGFLSNSFTDLDKSIRKVISCIESENNIKDIPVSEVDKSIRQFRSVIHDIERLNYIDNKIPDTELLEMEEIVRNVFAKLTKQLQDRSIELRITELINVVADKELIKELWKELLSNAIKFSDPKQITFITIGSDKKDEYVEYCIKDNGKGFSNVYAEEIFSPARKIIRKHGGKIRTKSEKDSGTVFYFTLPAYN